MPGLTRLRVRAGRIRPIYAFSGAITDLTAAFVEGDLILTFTGAPGATDHQLRFRIVGSNWDDWLDFEDPLTFEDGTPYEFQVRGLNGADFGPPSNIAIATAPWGPPEEISDLAANPLSLAPTQVEVTYSEPDSTQTIRYRYREVGEIDWSTEATLAANNRIVLPLAAQAYEIQLRPLNPDFTGSWSNTATVTTTAASLAFRDYKSDQNATQNDRGLVSHLGLNFVAGNLVVVFVCKDRFGTSGTTADAVEGSHGKTLIRFAKLPIASGEDVASMAAIFFIANGTEDILNIITTSGAAGTITNRIVTHAYSFNVVGTPTLGGSTGQLTTGDPAQQTIAAAAGAVPMWCFSFARNQGTQPDQTFDTQTPDRNDIAGSVSGPAILTRVKSKFFTSAPADILTDLADLGNANGIISGFISVI